MSTLVTEYQDDPQLMARLEAIRERRRSLFSQQSLAWLALPPGWTESLAARCEFPRPQSELRDFIAQARNAGLCETSAPANPSEGISFWMPAGTRRQTLEDLRSRTEPRWLWRAAMEIAEHIPAEDTSIPPAMARWAEMARQMASSTSNAAHFLTARVRGLIEDGRTGDALAWIATGEEMALAFGGQLEVAVRAGKRLLELSYRQAQDKRYLENFLERDEQIAAFNELLDDGQNWALHYVGVGGVGKTMLLRHLTSKLAPQHGRPTTRVDFDYLSPDYPARRPGQLLLELAVELRAYAASGYLEDKVINFQNTILEWHEALSSPNAPQHPLDILQGPLFDKAIRGFADVLHALERPAILILDTCEELAKSPIVDSFMPSVEATFTILERIHDAVPTVRVIFAGRRLLARAGSDWQIREQSKALLEKQTAKDSILPSEGQFLPASKPYLRLHEIRGFNRNDGDPAKSEVDRYFAKQSLAPPRDLREAILARSPELAPPPNITRTTARTASGEDQRYNPFDLALYSDWLREDPNLKVETINSGETDPYVELRIVQRIKQEALQHALPAVVLLRRFDDQMLRPMIGDSSLFDIYRQFGEQEWVSYQIDESRQASLLEVSRNLHGRLLGYYEHPSRRHLLDEARRTLAPALAELAGRPLGELAAEHLDAALRVLPLDEAGEVWEDVMRRIPAERDWGWLQNVIKLLRGEVGAIASETHPLFAAVRAAEISAQIHLTPSLNVASAWAEVAATAANHPNPEIGRWLARRALAGQVAASRDETLLPGFWKLLEEFSAEDASNLDDAARARHSQLAASIIAALESLQEAAESQPAEQLRFDEQPFPSPGATIATGDLPVELTAFVDLLAMRELLIRGPRFSNEAGAPFARLNLKSKFLNVPKRRQRWLDWRAPDSSVDRLRLEVLRLRPADVSAEDQAGWLEDAMERLDTIDGERLASLILQLRLAKEIIPEEELKKLDEAETYDASRLPTCNAHRTVPPLVVSIAQGYLALGRATEALAALNRRSDQTIVVGQDQDQQYAVELAEAQVIWRMRMMDQAKSFISRMTSSSNPQRQALIALMKSVCEPFPDPVPLSNWPRFPVESGQRRAAEQAMETAEHEPVPPDTGIAFFQQAFDSFSEAHDPVGALIAATEIAVASIRSGKASGQPDREALRERLQAAYENLNSSHQLPEWGRLIEMSLGSNPPGSGDLHAFPAALTENPRWANWEGWLLRLLGCLVWLNDTTDGRQRVQHWREWLQTRYAGGLPAELDLPIAEPTPEEAPAEYSNAWFALYAGIKLVWAAIIWLKIAESVHQIFVTGAATGNQVWDYWKSIGGFFVVLVFFTNLFEEQARNVGVPAREGWWRGFKRRFLNEKNHPGRFPQFVVKALSGLETAGLVGFSITLLIGLFLFLRWLWHAHVADLAAAHQQATMTIAVVAVLTGLFLIFRKRLAAAFRTIATWTELYIQAEGGGPRLDAAAQAACTIVARQREMVFSIPFLKSPAVSAVLSWPIKLPLWSLSLVFPFVPNPEEQNLIELDPRGLQPSLPESAQRAVRALLRAYCREAVEQRAAGQTPGLVSYASAAGNVPAEVVEQLKQTKNRLWFFESVVPLHVAPSLAFAPWEAMLALALGDGKQPSSEENLFFFRAGELLPDSGRERVKQAWRDPSLMTIGSSDWAALSTLWGLSKETEPYSARVLHITGKPLLTSSGIRLQAGGGFSSVTRGGQLISAMDTRLNFAWLVVLQADPIDTLTRLDTDREQSALMRVFATEVFEAGAPAVVTLPPMNETLAEKVIKSLAENLNQSSPPGPYKLAKAVQQARRLITEWRPESFKKDVAAQGQIIANQLELALDLCLFARQRSIETVLSRASQK